MRQQLRFSIMASFVAITLAMAASPSALWSQSADDDLLRPMIVRPTGDATASATAGAMAPITPPPVTATEEANNAPRLQLPSAPVANRIDLGGRMVMGSTSRDLFSNFGPSSGSAVADRVFQLRDEAIALRQAVDKNSAEFEDSRGKGAAGAIQYHSTVAAITARLEAGTTKGNPILLRQWSEAEQSLSEVNYSISRLNILASNLSSNSSAAAYLLQAVRAAYELSGALDEDHDQLSMVRDEVAKTAVQIDRGRNDVNEDIYRQNSYLANERRNLQTLALSISRGELIRNSIAAQPVVMGIDPTYGSLPNTLSNSYGFPTLSGEPTNIMPPPAPMPVQPVTRAPLKKASPLPMRTGANPVAGSPAMASAAALTGQSESLGQLLVLVRFNSSDVQYEQPMYQAVSTALDRKPDANFTVVAVMPRSDQPGTDTDMAQRKADEVKSSLVQLGLQPSRINMTNVSSEAAQSPEVHVYVR
jgi:hypothetical protein